MKLTETTFEPHFIRQAREKGFTAEQIAEAIERPYKITDVRRYPWQKRYCGGGVAIIMDGTRAVTIYADGVVTPLREDQKNDPEALRSRRLNG